MIILHAYNLPVNQGDVMHPWAYWVVYFVEKQQSPDELEAAVQYPK